MLKDLVLGNLGLFYSNCVSKYDVLPEDLSLLAVVLPSCVERHHFWQLRSLVSNCVSKYDVLSEDLSLLAVVLT